MAYSRYIDVISSSNWPRQYFRTGSSEVPTALVFERLAAGVSDLEFCLLCLFLGAERAGGVSDLDAKRRPLTMRRGRLDGKSESASES